LGVSTGQAQKGGSTCNCQSGGEHQASQGQFPQNKRMVPQSIRATCLQFKVNFAFLQSVVRNNGVGATKSATMASGRGD
jgi:hypothetical protein